MEAAPPSMVPVSTSMHVPTNSLTDAPPPSLQVQRPAPATGSRPPPPTRPRLRQPQLRRQQLQQLGRGGGGGRRPGHHRPVRQRQRRLQLGRLRCAGPRRQARPEGVPQGWEGAGVLVEAARRWVAPACSGSMHAFPTLRFCQRNCAGMQALMQALLMRALNDAGADAWNSARWPIGCEPTPPPCTPPSPPAAAAAGGEDFASIHAAQTIEIGEKVRTSALLLPTPPAPAPAPAPACPTLHSAFCPSCPCLPGIAVDLHALVQGGGVEGLLARAAEQVMTACKAAGPWVLDGPGRPAGLLDGPGRPAGCSAE
jgi:hypothetical protein